MPYATKPRLMSICISFQIWPFDLISLLGRPHFSYKRSQNFKNKEGSHRMVIKDGGKHEKSIINSYVLVLCIT